MCADIFPTGPSGKVLNATLCIAAGGVIAWQTGNWLEARQKKTAPQATPPAPAVVVATPAAVPVPATPAPTVAAVTKIIRPANYNPFEVPLIFRLLDQKPVQKPDANIVWPWGQPGTYQVHTLLGSIPELTPDFSSLRHIGRTYIAYLNGVTNNPPSAGLIELRNQLNRSLGPVPTKPIEQLAIAPNF